MIDPDVRPAVRDDAAALRELEAEARAALIDARGGGRWLEVHLLVGDQWEQAVASATVFLAVLDDVPVGYLVLDVDVDDGGGGIASVDQVFVASGARELGFGDALLEAALAAAREAGARVLEGEALPGDRDTKNLYERAGITARLITVSTRLA